MTPRWLSRFHKHTHTIWFLMSGIGGLGLEQWDIWKQLQKLNFSNRSGPVSIRTSETKKRQTQLSEWNRPMLQGLRMPVRVCLLKYEHYCVCVLLNIKLSRKINSSECEARVGGTCLNPAFVWSWSHSSLSPTNDFHLTVNKKWLSPE